MNELTLHYVGKDFLGMPVYRDSNGILLKDINYGDGELDLHTVSGDMDGDPNQSIVDVPYYQNVVFAISHEVEPPTRAEKQLYMMLGRMQRDCEYYLGCGNRNANQLWAGDETSHIENMKALYDGLPMDKKPEWLTYDAILAYEAQMTI